MPSTFPDIRLARTPEFDPPDTAESRQYIDSWIAGIHEAMSWLRDDQPSTFEIREVILTLDFVGEVRRQSGTADYEAERADVVPAAKTIRRADGAVIVLNLAAYPLDNPLAQRFLCLHEGLHARHHAQFDLDELGARPRPGQRAIGTAETLLDEYACDRIAFRILEQRSGVSRVQLAEALPEICLTHINSITSGQTQLQAHTLQAKFEAMDEQQGTLSPEQWGLLASSTHELAHNYWIRVIHTLSFLDHFAPAVIQQLTFDHNTPAALELVRLIRDHFEAENFNMEEAEGTVLTLLSEFGLEFAPGPGGRENVTPTAVKLHDPGT